MNAEQWMGSSDKEGSGHSYSFCCFPLSSASVTVLGPWLALGHCSCPFRGSLWGLDWVPDNTHLQDLKAQFERAPDPCHFYSPKTVRKSYLSLAVYSKDPFKNSVVQERGVGVGKWGEKAIIDCFILLRKTKFSILGARS